MPSTNKTDRGLSQFLGSDIPDWLQDYNADMRRIDAAFDAVDRREVARRERDPGLPDYGLGGAPAGQEGGN